MIICGDAIEELKKLDSNSVDTVITDPPYGLSFMGKKCCIVHGVYGIMGLWKSFGVKLIKQINAGYGLVLIMVLAMVKYALKGRSFIRIDCLMNGLMELYQRATILTIYAECQHVATQSILKQLQQALIVSEGKLAGVGKRNFV